MTPCLPFIPKVVVSILEGSSIFYLRDECNYFSSRNLTEIKKTKKKTFLILKFAPLSKTFCKRVYSFPLSSSLLLFQRNQELLPSTSESTLITGSRSYGNIPLDLYSLRDKKSCSQRRSEGTIMRTDQVRSLGVWIRGYLPS